MSVRRTLSDVVCCGRRRWWCGWTRIFCLPTSTSPSLRSTSVSSASDRCPRCRPWASRWTTVERSVLSAYSCSMHSDWPVFVLFSGIFFTYKPVGGEFSPPVPRTSRKQCKFQSGVTMYKGACGTNICLELPESCLEYDVVQHEVHAIDNFAPPVKFPRKIRCFVPPVLDYAPLSLSLRSWWRRCDCVAGVHTYWRHGFSRAGRPRAVRLSEHHRSAVYGWFSARVRSATDNTQHGVSVVRLSPFSLFRATRDISVVFFLVCPRFIYFWAIFTHFCSWNKYTAGAINRPSSCYVKCIVIFQIPKISQCHNYVFRIESACFWHASEYQLI